LRTSPRLFRLQLALACIVALTAGCSSRAAFSYRPSPVVAAPGPPLPLPVKVAVVPFRDLRGDDNTDATLVYLVPLAPFGWQNYDRPDAANGFITYAAYNFRPSEDFARATADELKQNGFFSEVFVTDREREPGVDLVLTGEIRKSTYEGKLISYGLSVEGPLLWIFGLPAGTVANDEQISLTLKRAGDGTVVWSHQISGRWSKTIGLYYNWGADFDGFPQILQTGLHDGMKQLDALVRKQPASFWTASPVPAVSAVPGPRLGMLGSPAKLATAGR
jgi:hypothetical protein